MKRLITAFCAALAASLAAPSSLAENFYVFKVTATIPVVAVEVGFESDKLITKTLKTNDIINLALGRPLSTKVDKKTEILAAAVVFEEEPPLDAESHLIVYDPTQNGVAGRKVIVAVLDELDWNNAYLKTRNKGQGFGRGRFLETKVGDPAQNGFLESPFVGSALASGQHAKNIEGSNLSPIATGTIAGHFRFRFTDKNNAVVNFDGIVARGALKLSGKRIGSFEADPE